MELIKPIKLNQTAPIFKKRVLVEFKDDNGIIRRGVMKSNDGHCCKILVGSETILVSRKEVKFV